MRNYDEEIERLSKEIRNLDLEKQSKETQLQRVLQNKETQLQRVLKEQEKAIEKKKEKKTVQTVDKVGKPIFIGDRVIATTNGRFKEQSGTVTNLKKWVTFTDANGVKQVRAPANLIVQDVRSPSCNENRTIAGSRR